jgi:hypothetical protein
LGAPQAHEDSIQSPVSKPLYTKRTDRTACQQSLKIVYRSQKEFHTIRKTDYLILKEVFRDFAGFYRVLSILIGF